MVVGTTSNVSVKEEKKEERWQTKIQSLSAGLRHIYETKEFSDCIFTVFGQKFEVHRFILGARSKKFEAMLLKPDPPKEITSDLCSKKGFELLLRYIYTDELGTSKRFEVLEAYRASKMFEQEELIEKCQELIRDWEISCDNVCSIINEVRDIDFVRERAIQYVKHNGEAVLNSVDFLEAIPLTLSYLFEEKCFSEIPVKVLLYNVIRWGTNQLPKPENYRLVRELLKDIGILGKLKIQKLSNEDLFNLSIDYPDFLTSVEFQQFNLNAFKPEKNLPLPEWCEL